VRPTAKRAEPPAATAPAAPADRLRDPQNVVATTPASLSLQRQLILRAVFLLEHRFPLARLTARASPAGGPIHGHPWQRAVARQPAPAPPFGPGVKAQVRRPLAKNRPALRGLRQVCRAVTPTQEHQALLLGQAAWSRKAVLCQSLPITGGQLRCGDAPRCILVRPPAQRSGSGALRSAAEQRRLQPVVSPRPANVWNARWLHATFVCNQVARSKLC